jgi:inward rectifier potassium channel
MGFKKPDVQNRRPEDTPDPKKKPEQAFHFGTGNPVSKELGFGTKLNEEVRLINPDGSFNVKRIGRRVFHPYHALITMPWHKFMLLVFLSYLAVNAFFTSLYMLIGVEQLTDIKPNHSFLEKFCEIFYFSCQTFTSVGYGRINPIGIASGIVSSIEALVGLLALALATGLIFARFTRPEAKLIFSKNAIVAPYREGRALMFKFANARSNQLIEVEVQLTLAILVEENEKLVRKFYPLPLENNKVNMFPLSWTIVHPINEVSPLASFMSEKDMQSNGLEVLINIKAFDDSFAQTVYSRYSYKSEEIVWGAKFPTIFYPENGTVVFDLSRMDEFLPAELPHTAKSVQINEDAKTG